jgi:hypothetical protein
MMSRKGIAFQEAIYLIISMVFLVVVVYVMLTTGLLATFREQFFTIICTFSSYGRGVLVRAIWDVWKIMLVVMAIILAIAGGGSVFGLAGSAASLLLFKQAIRTFTKMGSAGIILGALTGLDITMLLTYFMVTSILGTIPIICPVSTVDIGYDNSLAPPDKFYEIAGAHVEDTYNMFGKGDFDPIFGLDPPNPRTAFILETHLSRVADMGTLYEKTVQAYKTNWNLCSKEDLKVYLYCYTSAEKKYIYYGNNPDTWSLCSFEKARINLMYKDKHDYDLIAYGTSVCGGRIQSDADNFGVTTVISGAFGYRGDFFQDVIEGIDPKKAISITTRITAYTAGSVQYIADTGLQAENETITAMGKRISEIVNNAATVNEKINQLRTDYCIGKINFYGLMSTAISTPGKSNADRVQMLEGNLSNAGSCYAFDQIKSILQNNSISVDRRVIMANIALRTANSTLKLLTSQVQAATASATLGELTSDENAQVILPALKGAIKINNKINSNINFVISEVRSFFDIMGENTPFEDERDVVVICVEPIQ